MNLSVEVFEKLVPDATDRAIVKFAPWLNKTFDAYHIDSEERIAAFMAQITHESGSFRYLEEIADGTAYNERKDLGNTTPEALEQAKIHNTPVGSLYKGRGLIQITGYYNYRNFSHAMNMNFIAEPELLCKPQYATLSAGWFWKTHGLNELADEFKFTQITKRINGGTNGLSDRLKHYHRNLEVLGVTHARV